MTVKELTEKLGLEVITLNGKDTKITGVYCCDLLSIVMGRAFSGCAWITVMANINAVAVASLAEIGLVIFADGARPDETVISKAKENEINLVCSDKNIFDTALLIYEALK